MSEIVLNILVPLVSVVITTLISIFIAYMVSLIKTKIKNQNVQQFLSETLFIIDGAVKETNQKFVDSLKSEGKFDKEKQEEAFKMTFDTVVNQLNDKTKEFIKSTYGDLESWVKTQIESNIYSNK